jgi:cysteinyl-tRNA synthetase
MSMKYLGETFDLHVGGEDLVFPHHENEIAQSTGATGKPFVRHWMHVKHLLIEEETMSKSKGNFFTIPDLLEKGHPPEAIRYLLAGSHYRKPLSFGFEGLQQAAAALERIRGLVQRLDEVEAEGPEGPAAEACTEAETAFREALADDLNTPEALAGLHGLVSRANALLADAALTRSGAAAVRTTLERMDSVLGLLLPAGGDEQLSAEEQALLDERQEARRQRDFTRADSARARLEAMGVVLEDTRGGTRWRRKR